MTRGGIPLSACIATVGEEQKAPRAILIAVFCMVSSSFRWGFDAEPYKLLPYIIFERIAIL